MVRRFIAVTAYALSMGYLESAVVVYLRTLSHQDISRVFPLHYLAAGLGLIETGREAATIIMLVAVGYLAGKGRLQKWMYFVYMFAIWDLSYYLFLKILTGWPDSFMTFDVLFLIPVIWIGPVAAPILVSAALAIFSTWMIYLTSRKPDLQLRKLHLGLFVVSCLIIILSFTEQIFHILLSVGPKGLENFSPRSFDWLAFIIGYLILCAASVVTIRNSYHKMISER